MKFLNIKLLSENFEDIHSCEMSLILTILLFSPEHPSPGIVSLEEVVHPVQLRLVKVCVVEEPLPVPGQKARLLH